MLEKLHPIIEPGVKFIDSIIMPALSAGLGYPVYFPFDHLLGHITPTEELEAAKPIKDADTVLPGEFFEELGL